MRARRMNCSPPCRSSARCPGLPLEKRRGRYARRRVRVRRTLVSSLVLIATMMTGCADQSGETTPLTPSVPGFWTVTLVGPNGDEGGAIVSVYTGGSSNGSPRPSDIRPVGVVEAYPWPFGGQGLYGTSVALIHPEGGELSFQVVAVGGSPPPTVGLDMVAGPDNLPRASLEGYSLSIR